MYLFKHLKPSKPGPCPLCNMMEPYPLTGLPDVDRLLGISANPKKPLAGILLLSGPKSSGKTLLAMHMVKQVLAQGRDAFYIDLYNGTGLNELPDGMTLLTGQIETQALEYLAQGLQTPNLGIIVLDGLERIRPSKPEDEILAWRTRTVTALLPKVSSLCNDKQILMVLVTRSLSEDNIREDNGLAVLFHSWLRLYMEPAGVIARESRIKVHKNLHGPTQGHESVLYLPPAWS